MRSTDLQLQSLRNDVIWESILLGLFCDVACLARACAFCQAPLLKLYGLYWAEGKYEIGVGVKNPPLEPHTTIRSRTPRSPPIIQKWDKIKQGHLKTLKKIRQIEGVFSDFLRIFVFFENGDGELLLDMRLQFVIEERWRRTVFFWLCLVLVIMMMIMEVARYFDGSGKNPTQFSPFDLK